MSNGAGVGGNVVKSYPDFSDRLIRNLTWIAESVKWKAGVNLGVDGKFGVGPVKGKVSLSLFQAGIQGDLTNIQGYLYEPEASLQIQLGPFLFGPTTGRKGKIFDDEEPGNVRNLERDPQLIFGKIKAGKASSPFDNPTTVSVGAGAIGSAGLGVDAHKFLKGFFYWFENSTE